MKPFLAIILTLALAACDVNRPAVVDLGHARATGTVNMPVCPASESQPGIEANGSLTLHVDPGAFTASGPWLVVNVAPGAVVVNAPVQVGSATQPLATVNTPDVPDMTRPALVVAGGGVMLAIIITGGILLHHLLAKKRNRLMRPATETKP